LVLGGIFKETDCGKWVHLVCALYVPGITFGEVTSLSKVMLFPNTSPRWGSKSCTLCKDIRFVCTGVTIACDAGLCRSNFHVTWYDKYIFSFYIILQYTIYSLRIQYTLHSLKIWENELYYTIIQINIYNMYAY